MVSEEVLAKAQQVLVEKITPLANQMDGEVAVLREGLKAIEEAGLFSLRRSSEYGGPNVDSVSFRTFQELIARYSGCLAFLQTQHQSAVSLLSTSENKVLKDELLPHVDKLSGAMGIGFSQLRRPGEPMMRASEMPGGYIFEGQVPWATGAGFFPLIMVGAQLPDGRAVFAVTPFENVGEMIKLSEPMKLAAMEAAQTVSIEFKNFFVSEDRVAFIRPQGWIHESDMINVTLQGYFALGCAQAGIDIVRQVYARRPMAFLESTAVALEEELVECREGLAQLDHPLPVRLESRARAIDLAARCAHAGVVASSGAANSKNHPAQRVYREALVFSVSAQTTPIMEASLKRLTDRGHR